MVVPPSGTNGKYVRVEPLWLHKCQPDDTLDRAALLMWEHDCGCVPVCTPSSNGARHAIGILTDRNICMHALFQGKPLRELRVADAMAKDVRVCRPGDALSSAEQIMSEARVRRLPVISDDGALIGVISLADLAHQAARERTKSQKEITEAEIGDTLATITQPTAAPLVA